MDEITLDLKNRRALNNCHSRWLEPPQDPPEQDVSTEEDEE